MTGRTLLVVRHAKAEADAATDVERPLAARGHADAAMAGQWLAELGVSIGLAVVSPAARAQETWAEISESVWAASFETDERIYEATTDDLFAVLTEVSQEVSSVVLIGHSPGVHALTDALDDGKGDAEARAELRDGYPTCGIAIFDVPVPWADLAPGTATLFTFAAPRG
jgi:phosphohistidine phosphatase